MPLAQPSLSRRRLAAGASLTEVLVALVVASVGMLGTAALHTRAIQMGTDAADRNRAALLANELASTMWMQRKTTLPQETLDAWKAKVGSDATSGLPNATASVSDPDANGMVTITIRWQPNSHVASNDMSYQYVTQVVVP